MRIVTVLGNHITETQQIQLLLPSIAGCIDGKQDRPGDQAPNKTYRCTDLQVSEQEKSIDCVVVEHVRIRNLDVFTDPVEEARRQSRRSFASKCNQSSNTLPDYLAQTYCSRSAPKKVLGT